MLPLVLLLGATPDGAALIAKFECHRCHQGLGAEARLEKSCVGCHEAIDAGTWNAPKAKMDQWRENLVSFRAVPDLSDLSGLRSDWIVEFLLAPKDVRPNLNGMMPRLSMTRAEAEQIAAHLTRQKNQKKVPRIEQAAEIVADREALHEGRTLFDELACAQCHSFSGVIDPPPRPNARAMSAAQLLAPDLAETRRRMTPGTVRTLLTKPKAIRATALMPAFDLDPPAVQNLLTFIFASPIATSAPVTPPALPILSRDVRFAEVKREVFEKACQHCHANPERSFNDGGPGNTGGFGYAGRSLSLASYREVMSGSRDKNGRRRSIFKKTETGRPRIIDHLLARRQEVLFGREVPGVIGMPMALPPLSPEQIQLLETWIAQGRPR